MEIEFHKINKKHIKEMDEKLAGIIEEQNNNTQKFYDEFYAIKSNQEDIQNNYINETNNLDIESKNIKEKIVKDVEINQNKIDNELKKFIHSKDILIKNIPDDVKNKKNDLKNENKKFKINLKEQRADARALYIKQKIDSYNNIYEINMNLYQRLSFVKRKRKHEEKLIYKKHQIKMKKLEAD